jgi:spermidine synthase
MAASRQDTGAQSFVSKLNNKLLVLGAMTSDRNTIFKFCEPPGTPREVLSEGLLKGTYRKPFLVEEFNFRSLCFALDGCTQSEMRINDPYELVNEYTRKMMGFLAFQPRPKQILIVGLGGGSLVKYCHRHLPHTKVIAVEIDPDVLAMRSQFFIPPDDDRFQVILADGAAYVAQIADHEEEVSVILVDAFDHAGIASAVVERTFLENTKRLLGSRGVLVMNIVAEVADSERHVSLIKEVFGDSVVVIAVRGDSNLVVFASQTMEDPQRLAMAVRNAERYETRLGLLFPTLIQRLTELLDRWSFEPSTSHRREPDTQSDLAQRSSLAPNPNGRLRDAPLTLNQINPKQTL